MSSCFLQILIWFLLATLSTTENGKEVFEIESAVIRCQNPQAVDDDDFRVVNWKPRPLTSFGVPIKPGPHDPNSALDMEVENDIDLNITRMTKCVSQAIITVKVKHTGNIPLEDGGTLIKLDHFLDERSGKSVRLGNPLGIKIQEGPLFAVYPLKYLRTINAEPKEVVTNYPNARDLGECNGDVCGSVGNGIEGDSSHDSAGFCCSCGADNFKGQLRGGHKCNQNKSDTFYSTHCFHQSDYWYAVFEIGAPEIFHQVYIQVYKSEEKDGTLQWKMADGKGQMAQIDPLNTTTFMDDENLSIVYRKVESGQEDKLISAKNALLIPTLFYASASTPISMKDDENSHELYQKHPVADESKNARNLPAQFKNGMDDAVLVVPKKLVGGKCNEVGVTMESFATQPSPCRETSGTCLVNQPFALWDSDKSESAATGIHYRLKHFGKVHDPAPFKRIKDKMHFVMEHEGDAVGYIDIQLPADQLEVMRPGYTAQLVSVLSGCSSSAGAKLIVEVANAEHVPAFYGVNLLSCTHHLPLQKSELRVIDALRVSTFQLDLHYPPTFQLHHPAKCAVGVLNQHNEVVAFRTVLLSPGDTCICALNCKCACAEESTKFACIPLSDDEILSAGFPDPQEFIDYGDELTDFLTIDKLPYLIVIVLLILILLGICKALLGLCGARKVKKFGLWYFENKPRKLHHYYEKEYARLVVIYDQAGNPVDPFTKLPTVERLSRCEQFVLNTLFFLFLPAFCCCNCCCWCFCSRKLSESNHRQLSPSDEEPVGNEEEDEEDKGDTDGTPEESQATLNGRNLSEFGSPADSYHQMYEDSSTMLQGPSHRSLFSSTNETPYGSWHQKPGQGPGVQAVKSGQQSKMEERANYTGPAPAPSTKAILTSNKSGTMPAKSTTVQIKSPTTLSKSTTEFPGSSPSLPVTQKYYSKPSTPLPGSNSPQSTSHQLQKAKSYPYNTLE